MINKITGKQFKTMVYIKHSLNNFKIKASYIFKTSAVNNDYYFEFYNDIFILTNSLVFLAGATFIDYGNLLKLGLSNYYIDLAAKYT